MKNVQFAMFSHSPQSRRKSQMFCKVVKIMSSVLGIGRVKR